MRSYLRDTVASFICQLCKGHVLGSSVIQISIEERASVLERLRAIFTNRYDGL